MLDYYVLCIELIDGALCKCYIKCGCIIQVLKNLKTLEQNKEKRKYRARVIEDMKCVERSKSNAK